MKKLLYSLLTLAAALTVASCQKEPVNNADPSLGGPTVKATVSLSVDGLVDTKTFASAENAKKLHIAFYSGGELVEPLSKVGDGAIDLTAKSYTYELKLGKGVAYDIICWAEAADSPYALDFTAKTVTYKENVALSANNDAYDAFYGTASLTAEDTAQKVNLTVNLKRPFAQVNVLVPDENVANYKSFKSKMDVTVPTTMNLADGTLTGDAKKVSFAEAAISEPTFKEGNTYVAMNYVFAPAEAANYAVSFTVTPDVAADAASLDLSAVSLKRNRRTNLVGKIFDNEVDGSITVIILPDPDGDEEVNTEAADPDVTVALPTGGQITEPLTIEQVGGTASVLLTTNTTGALTVSSEDEAVATAASEAGQGTDTTNQYTVTATAVGEGTTYIVADLEAGTTKGDLKAAQVKIQVKVGDGVKKGEQSLAWKLDDKEVTTCTVTLNADDQIFPTLDVTNAKGAVSYASSNTDAATVNAETGAVTLVAAGETTITATAAEFTDEETGLLYPEASASYTLTVGEAVVVKKDVTITIVDKVTELTVGQEVGFVAEITEEGAEGTLDLPLTWASSDAAVTVTADATSPANATVKGVSEGSATITVSFAGNDAYNEATASVDVTVSDAQTEYDFTTIAELKAKLTTTAASFSGKLTDAVVSFVPGTGDAVIKDATASILYHKSSHGLKQGQTFSGDITVEALIYNGLYSDITSIGETTFTGEGATVEPEVVTLAQLTAEGGYANYEDAYVKVVGMTSGTTTTAKGNINATQDGASYIVYTNVAIPINTGDIFTAEGTVTKYNTTEELKVWKKDHLTITEHAEVKTVISGVPETKNMKPGETYTLAGTTNSGVAVTYVKTTDASNVATLENGVVTISNSATVGATVVITASAAASTGYTAADDVTCTITVVSSDAEPTSYTLDGAAIKAAHSEAWNYESGLKTITATDGSVWTAYNTFGNTEQVTVQMNKGKSAYVLTPTVPNGKKITKITVVTNKRNDGTGDPGDRPLDIQSADGQTTLHSNVTNYADGLTISGDHTALRVICNESNGGATYIVSITIEFA